MTCLICEPKRPWRIFDVVIHILMGKLKRMLLDAHCWFLWEIQELSCEELNSLTLKLIAAVLLNLFFGWADSRLNKIKNSLKLDFIFSVLRKWSSFHLERILAKPWSWKRQHKTLYRYGYFMSSDNFLCSLCCLPVLCVLHRIPSHLPMLIQYLLSYFCTLSSTRAICIPSAGLPHNDLIELVYHQFAQFSAFA